MKTLPGLLPAGDMNLRPKPRLATGRITTVNKDIRPLGIHSPRDVNQREIGNGDSARGRLAGCAVRLVDCYPDLGDVRELDVFVSYVCHPPCFIAFGFDSNSCTFCRIHKVSL